jgi:ketosteroid isomerase-like protein
MQMRLRHACSALLGCLSLELVAQGSDESQIRAARLAYNRAIAAHDTTAMTRSWLPEYVGVSSTNTVTVGRDAMRSRFAGMIKTRPDIIYVRTPDSVAVNTSWGQAAEYGTWTGRWTQHDGVTNVNGRYFAKWAKTQDKWMLLSEVFVQLNCTGSSYCTQP